MTTMVRPRSLEGFTPTERRTLEVSTLVASGLYSVCTLGLFATGNIQLGYTMAMFGGFLGTIFGALRLWSSFDAEIAQ